VMKKKLNAHGVRTIEDLAALDREVGIPQKLLEKMKRYAEAWVKKRAIVMARPKFASSARELFLDFEGTDEFETAEGLVKVDYMIGVLVREGAKVQYHVFVSSSLQDEKKMFLEWVQFMEVFKGCPVYHYGAYERTHLGDLAKKYQVDLTAVLKNMVDVLQVVKKCVAFPTRSMSFLGYAWRGVADAQESIVLYLEFLETKQESLLKKIMDYNEDDVRATMVVKDFLAGLKEE